MPTHNNDVLRATEARQTIHAGGGDDEFYWNPAIGSVTFHGGDTNERYDANPYMDRTGGDRLFIESKIGVNLRFDTTEDGIARQGANVLKFTGVERLHLGSGDDTINGARAHLAPAHDGTPTHGLTVYAGDGNDVIIGTAFDDFIDGGSGNDTIRAGDGHDFIQSSTGDDLIYGGDGSDNIRWGQGNFDEVVGNDTIYGGAGQDLMNVWIKGGYENSPGVAVKINWVAEGGSFAGTSQTDFGGARSTLQYYGMEQLWTHEGRDTIDGSGAVIGRGGAGFQANARWGDDVVLGSRGNDTLEGGEGRDTINGGRGDDLISANGDFFNMRAPGDGDRDTLIFRAGDGHDTVLGFDTRIDVLDLGGRHYTATENAHGTLLTIGSDTILLSNVFDLI
ncbi:calcium-binding protein [Paracoccus laeviglucosivorans]|uniref:Hemolysin-type calcium-binding repeat-containing protein n=1 Tax=Paracoccus laeviglucosivorans TaxID=1197861 RepID=A0A521D2J7_9RHOB|nr:hypothetical protein [Paracoccus laeviglucosivorans]SMO65913.1 Hemolysin-type calcium-binding repeat-containing protein [Paracoccus laeviglucosivorans]